MADPKVAGQEPQPPQSAPQPPVQQQVYVTAPPKTAVHPALELGLAVFSVLASAWLLVNALLGAMALFGDRTANTDSISAFALTHLGGYTGVVVTSLLSVAFAAVAFWLFRRVTAAIESDKYKGIVQVGCGIVLVKTLLLAVTTVAVGLTPLLTIQKGLNVGPVYLYEFLPLLLATGVFFGLSWYMVKLVGKQQVGKFLSMLLLIAAGVVFILGFVAVIVTSHRSGTSRSESSSSSRSSSDSSDTRRHNTNDSDWDSMFKSNTNSGSERSKSSSATSDCFADYQETSDASQYSQCLREAYQ